MRIGLLTVLVVAGAAFATASVSIASRAGGIERVQVGVSGRNATRGLSPLLYVVVPVVRDYRQTKFDGEQAEWRGPDYHATQKAGTDATTLFLRSEFASDAGSLAGMTRKALVHTTWPVAAKESVKVPRLLGGRTVGAVAGLVLLAGEPIEGSARFESVVAIPLCHGVFGAIDFYAGAPPQDASGSAGQYLVGDTPAKQWNHDHALAATHGVKLDGPLPGGRISARRVGAAVSGAVADCGGGLQHVPLQLQRNAGAGWTTVRRGASGPGGRFRLAIRGAGRYRVVAAVGPFKAASAAVG
jgi:hypothetical protein